MQRARRCVRSSTKASPCSSPPTARRPGSSRGEIPIRVSRWGASRLSTRLQISPPFYVKNLPPRRSRRLQLRADGLQVQATPVPVVALGGGRRGRRVAGGRPEVPAAPGAVSGLYSGLLGLGREGLAAGQQTGLALLLEPVALALDVDDRGVVEQPVEQRRGDDLVAENLAPAGEALVGGQQDRAALVAP